MRDNLLQFMNYVEEEARRAERFGELASTTAEWHEAEKDARRVKAMLRLWIRTLL